MSWGSSFLWRDSSESSGRSVGGYAGSSKVKGKKSGNKGHRGGKKIGGRRRSKRYLDCMRRLEQAAAAQ